MKNNLKAMVLASFAADALALGAHWIYDQKRIEQDFGLMDTFHAPLQGSFHPTKIKGDLTHYGAQTLCLLRSVAECGGFDSAHFRDAWQEMFRKYDGYRDSATRETLQQMEAGANAAVSGSSSSELGGASRIAPLVYRYANERDALIDAARQQASMTHNNPLAVASAVFFADTAKSILDGAKPLEAIEIVSRSLSPESPLVDWVRKGIDSAAEDTRRTLRSFGLNCEAASAFLGVIHLIARHADNLKTALIENVMSGGDSAARGLIVGALLGAHLCHEAVPELWISGLNSRDRILDLIKRIDGRQTL